MAIDSVLRLALVEAFDELHRMLDRPVLYAIPWQTPAGASYSADVDAWIDDEGDVVSKEPSELTYYAIPALWGEDADSLALMFGGKTLGGDVTAICKAEYSQYLNKNTFLVVTGSLSGDRYVISRIESAPDGGAPIFVVAGLNRNEA